MKYKPYYPELHTFRNDAQFRRDVEFAIRNLDNVDYFHRIIRGANSIIFKTSHMDVGLIDSCQYENTWLVFPMRH